MSQCLRLDIGEYRRGFCLKGDGKMKKFLSIALAAVMALGLTACGEKAPAADNSAAADEPKVVVFWYDESDVYLGSVRDAMNKEFEALGITPDNQFAANNQTTQLDQIKTAIAGGADILVVNQVTSGASDTAEDIIAAAGDIPVVFFNREPQNTEIIKGYEKAIFVGTTAKDAGIIQGDMIVKLWNGDAKWDKNGDGVMQYVMLQGVNDQEEHAIELTQLLRGLNVYVNLIPYNETNHIEFKRTSKEQIMKFYDVLKKKGINVTIRKEFGGKIDAACGQLRSKEVKA